MRALRRSAVTGSLAVLATLAVACVSERGVTAPDLTGECRLPLQPGVPGSTLVIIKDFAFEPAEVTVQAGTTVTWVNCAEPDEPAHTTTADQGAWNSPLLPPGASFTHTFSQAGSFPYHCEPHPFMTGSIVVEP
ncbi:MAG: cupredoxin family copper-binding protein [Gemmatimonadota bacterium]|nr:cupredoxin family copper-binding protein [Gemmatimonadota bacterium]